MKNLNDSPIVRRNKAISNEALASSLAEIVSLLSFPKQGTETDDTARLQRALNSLSNKKILRLEAKKTYTISNLLSLSNLNDIEIEANGAKIVCLSEFGDALKFTSCTNVTIKGLEIVGGETNVGSRNFSVTALITFTSCTNVLLEKCNLHNGNGNGISAIDSINVVVKNNDIYQVNLHQIWANRCDTVLIEWNRLTGIGNVNGTLPIGTSSEVSRGGLGYLATKGNNHMIRHNTIKNSSDTGSKTEGTNNVTYDSNYVENCGKDGIKIQDYASVAGYSLTDPAYSVSNGKIINNTVKNLYAWRSDGAALILMYNCKGGEIRGNIVYGGAKPTSVTDLNSIVKPQEENAIRVQYCEDTVIDGHIERTATSTDSYYLTNNKNVVMTNCQFKKHGRFLSHTGNDFVSNNDIGYNPLNLNDNAFFATSPTNIILNNNRINGLIQIQPSTTTKSIRIRDNEIIQNGTTDTVNVTNFTSSNAAVENLEIVNNTIKVVGTVTTSRIIRVGCDKTPYRIVKVAGNTVDRNGQTSLPLLTILADASGNSFKITDLLTGSNFPAYVHSAGNSANVVTNTAI